MHIHLFYKLTSEWISWLLFSLAWGTVRIFGIKLNDAPKEITTEESLWGFGQFVPTLLLIIPLVGLIEGILGMSYTYSLRVIQRLSIDKRFKRS